MDTDASFAYNHALSLKICQEIKLMTKPSRRQKKVQVTKKARVRDDRPKGVPFKGNR